MQVTARGGGECARTDKFARTGLAANNRTFESIAGAAQANPTTCCFAAPLCFCGCDTGPVFFFDTAQQVLFAQQLGGQASGLGAFERMQDAAGNWNGAINIASTIANTIAAALRIT